MDDAVGAEEVCCEELCGVDVEVVAVMGDGDVFALLRKEFGAVCEAGGVHNLGEDVVVQDGAEFLDSHICDGWAESLEGVVLRSEDGGVRGVREVLQLVRRVERAFQSREVKGI